MKISYLYTELVTMLLHLDPTEVANIQYELAVKVAFEVYSENYANRAIRSPSYHHWFRCLCNVYDHELATLIQDSGFKPTYPSDAIELFKNNYELGIEKHCQYPPSSIVNLINRNM